MAAGIAPLKKRPAWKALEDHYQQVRELHLRKLFADDPQRERLTAAALVKDSALSEFAGRVSDSGEGRRTIKAAIDEAVPVLSTALNQRFSSRGESDYQDKVLSAMRFQFRGHLENSAP